MQEICWDKALLSKIKVNELVKGCPSWEHILGFICPKSKQHNISIVKNQYT